MDVAGRLEHNVDDQTLTLRLTEERAEYHRLLGDHSRASIFTLEAMAHAEKLDEPKSKARSFLTQARLAAAAREQESAVWEFLRQAEEILAGLPLQREKLTIRLDRVQFLLDLGSLSLAQEVFEQIRLMPQFEGINTFEARINYINGQIESHNNRHKRAVTLFHDAYIAAKTLPNPEQTWRSLAALGETYQTLTEYERAFKCFIEAFETLKELAEGIVDPALKQRYLSDPAKLRIAEKLEEMSTLAT